MDKYVYRFLDKKKEVLYVGKTKNLKSRINQHFNNGHLKKAQYKKVDSIEFMMFISESDQHIAEIYLINKYKPIFNSSDKKEDHLTLQVNIIENWRKIESKNIEGFYNSECYPKPKNETLKEELERLKVEVNNLIENLEIERNITDKYYTELDKLREKFNKSETKLKNEIKQLKNKLNQIQELSKL